jgi:uncharacterized protein YgfB (UPF0149 family)
VTEDIPFPDYQATADAMQRVGLTQSPAEAHGFAIGLQLGGVADAPRAWQRELYADLDPRDVLAEECRRLLDRVYAAATAPDEGDGFGLMLPESIEVDAISLGAVRDWCQGFMFGFGLGGEKAADRLSAQSREWLRDMAEIGLLETDDVENSDENQAALIEVEEYLRVGVMLIREDVAAAGEKQ